MMTKAEQIHRGLDFLITTAKLHNLEVSVDAQHDEFFAMIDVPFDFDEDQPWVADVIQVMGEAGWMKYDEGPLSYNIFT